MLLCPLYSSALLPSSLISSLLLSSPHISSHLLILSALIVAHFLSCPLLCSPLIVAPLLSSSLISIIPLLTPHYTDLYHADLSLILYLFFFLSYSASLLCVPPHQLNLFCGPTGEDPKLLNPTLTHGNLDQMVKYHDLNNRKAFKLTDYAIHYQILPFSLFSNEGHDLRYERKGIIRFMEIFITDNRLRIWRQKFLDYLQKEKESENMNLDDILPTSDKKRRTSIAGSENDRASTPQLQDVSTESTYEWPEPSAVHSVAPEHTVVNKVNITQNKIKPVTRFYSLSLQMIFTLIYSSSLSLCGPLPSFLPTFLPSFLPFFLPTSLPSFLPTFLL